MPLNGLAKQINVKLFLSNRFQDDSTVSIGICLPASCSVDRLKYVLNEVIQRKISADIHVMIPKPLCQFEEKDSQLQKFDLFIL